jgi:hypothetical protein
MRKTFAILAASIMVFLTFGALTASADDCITVSGVITGTYSTVNPCEEVTTPLVGATVTITDEEGFDTIQTVYTLAESGFIFKKPAGRYSASVYKGLDYKITVTYSTEINGIPYKFEGSEEFTAGEEDKTLSLNIDGILQKSKALNRIFIFQNFIQRLVERANAIRSLF